MDPLISRALGCKVIHDENNKPDLVVKGHKFMNSRKVKIYPQVPYIICSGESLPVPWNNGYAPLFELNTFHSERPRSIHFPHLFAEIRDIKRPQPIMPKRWCLAYSNSKRIPLRNAVFAALRLRERTCYSFGRCLTSKDRPFSLDANERERNGESFREFAFYIAMENRIKPGYLTEKIGHAFNAGTVPLYWGDTACVESFFNPDAFINVLDFVNTEKLAEHVLNIWRDKQKLQRYLEAPIFASGDLFNEYRKIYTEYAPWQQPAYDALLDAFPECRPADA
jgi:hypothetical protein